MSSDAFPLNFQQLKATYDFIKARTDLAYRFRVPGLNEDLDLRDYQLKEACGSYFLVRKEEPTWKAEFNEWRFTFPYEPCFHPAHFIWLQGCSPEQARQIRQVMP